MSNDEEYNKTRHKLRRAEADVQYHIDLFGDYLAKKHKYKNLRGIEAVWFYLIQKHHWTPAVVRALNTEDLRFLLEEEMSGWTVGKSVPA